MIPYKDLLNRAPNAYVVVDRELRIVWMNDAYLAVTGRERCEITGRAMFDAFPADEESDSYRKLRSSFDRAFASGKVDEIAHIRYDIANPDGSVSERYWSATHTPIFDEAGQTIQLLQHTVDITELHNLRRLRDEMGVVERARAVSQRLDILSDEADTLRAIFEQAPGFVAMLTGTDHRFVMANAAYRKLVGRDDLLGKPVAEALPEVAEQGFIAVLDQVLQSGAPYFGVGEKVALKDGADEQLRERYLEFVFQPIRDRGGEVSGVLVQGYDVTEETEAEARQRLLIDELNHRVKNTLAIVQGLAQQSFGTRDHDRSRMKAFSDRLGALAMAHNILTKCNWEAADLRTLVVDGIVAAAGSLHDRIAVDGPRITLNPQQAVALAMIIHELSTNAIKYGALSNDAGTVAVQWTAVPGPDGCRMQLDWTESGGPAVTPPERRGFGTRLIGHGLGSGPDHKVSLDYAPSGLHCRIEALL